MLIVAASDLQQPFHLIAINDGVVYQNTIEVKFRRFQGVRVTVFTVFRAISVTNPRC
jgi:hypothetical protein